MFNGGDKAKFVSFLEAPPRCFSNHHFQVRNLGKEKLNLETSGLGVSKTRQGGTFDCQETQEFRSQERGRNSVRTVLAPPPFFSVVPQYTIPPVNSCHSTRSLWQLMRLAAIDTPLDLGTHS